MSYNWKFVPLPNSPTPPPFLWQTSNVISFFMFVLFCLIPHMSEIIQHLSFSDLLHLKLYFNGTPDESYTRKSPELL